MSANPPPPSGEFPEHPHRPIQSLAAEVTMWNADFEWRTLRPGSPEVEPRPEPEPLLQKANLEAIASILAVGVLRWRARKGASPGDVGRKSKNLQI